MFEDSTFESNGRIRTRSRGWMLAAFVFNGTILLALILIPLIYPEALPRQSLSLLLEAPRPPAAPQPAPQPKPTEKFRGVPQMDGATIIAPRRIPITIAQITGPEAPATMNGLPMGGDDSNAAAQEAFQGQRHVSVSPAAPKGPLHLSSGVVSGLLLTKTTPIYPPIAVAARVEGTVVLAAAISASGAIENLRVVSGHPMLQRAALDAVSNWRYRPFLLNGQPVEVETTINVIFTLNH
ncbi:MAG TPA: TonB family protein [Terracidiphilus sp.]|jgi:protein TonB